MEKWFADNLVRQIESRRRVIGYWTGKKALNELLEAASPTNPGGVDVVALEAVVQLRVISDKDIVTKSHPRINELIAGVSSKAQINAILRVWAALREPWLEQLIVEKKFAI